MDAFLRAHKTAHPSEATHLSLTGGKYSIRSLADVHAFRKLYIREPNRHCLVERVCYPSVLYMDLDHCSLDATKLANTLRSSFDNVYIYTNREGGYHIVLRAMIATSPTDAVRLCENVCRTCPLISPFVDVSVYFSGLRMIGSKKSSHVARVYYPIRTNRTITVLDLEQSSIHHQIQTSRPWVGKRAPDPRTRTPVVTGEVRLNFHHLHEQYTDIKVQDVKYTRPFVSIISDSTFCPNVNRLHRSKKAYFVINMITKTMVHKCLCKCETTGCKDYRSRVIDVPPRAYSTIHALVS
jgi:hypothetical protein